MDISSFLVKLAGITTPVLSDQNQQLSGKELVDRIEALALELGSTGFQKGTSVLIRMSNSNESVIAFFGALLTGATVFVGNPYDPIDRITQLVEQFGLGCIIGEKPALMAVEARSRQLHENARLNELMGGRLHCYASGVSVSSLEAQYCELKNADVAIFSSGTTGQPKAILHSVSNLLRNASAHADAIGLKSSDVVAGFLPVYYSYGLVANLFASLMTGSHFVFQPRSGTFNEGWANTHQISVLALTPFFGQSLEVRVPSLRVMTFGGDALSSDVALQLKERFKGCELYSTYGLTEAGPRVATWRFDNKAVPSGLIVPLGEPLSTCSLGLKTSDSNVGLGELVVTTSTKTLGYYYGPVSKGQRGLVVPEWPENDVLTGDLFFQIDGQYYFASRDKEMIVQNGEKIFPPLVESILKTIPQVGDARVEGKHDEQKGQIAVAYVQLNAEIEPVKLRRLLLQQLPHAVIPAEIIPVEQITRSATGKKTKQITPTGGGRQLPESSRVAESSTEMA